MYDKMCTPGLFKTITFENGSHSVMCNKTVATISVCIHWGGTMSHRKMILQDPSHI